MDVLLCYFSLLLCGSRKCSPGVKSKFLPRRSTISSLTCAHNPRCLLCAVYLLAAFYLAPFFARYFPVFGTDTGVAAGRMSGRMSGVNKYQRRRLLPTLAAAVLCARMCSAKIEWSETTSSSSDNVMTAFVGEMITVSYGDSRRIYIEPACCACCAVCLRVLSIPNRCFSAYRAF